MSRLDKVFDMAEDCLEFYKRCTIYVGFGIYIVPIEKNKQGIYQKWYVCFEEGFHHPIKNAAIAPVTTKPRPQARDGHKQRKLKRMRANTGEGYQADILLRLTDDGKFKIIEFHEGHIHPLCTPSSRNKC